MYSLSVSVLLSYAAQVDAKLLAANRPIDEFFDTLTNKLVDRLFGRTVEALFLHYADLDSSTLGKSSGDHDHNQDQGQAEWTRTQPLARFSRTSKSAAWPEDEFGMNLDNTNAEGAAMATSGARNFQKEVATATAATPAAVAAAEATFLYHPDSTSQTSQSDRSDTEDGPAEHFVPLLPLASKLVDKLISKRKITASESSSTQNLDLDKELDNLLDLVFSEAQSRAEAAAAATSLQPPPSPPSSKTPKSDHSGMEDT